jgi:ATP-binding cassette subfamily C protein LapB
MSIVGAKQDNALMPGRFKIEKNSLLVTTLAINILSLALPVMTLQIYDRILPSQGSGTLPILTAGVCLAVTLEAVLRLARSYALGWAGAAFEHRLSCQAMRSILGSDLSYFGANGAGENIGKMNAIGKLKDFHNGYSMTALSELMFVPLFLFLIVYIAGSLAFVPVIVLMAFVLISLFQGKKLRARLNTRGLSDDARYNFLIETLEGIHTLKSFALENHFSRRYERLEEKSTVSNYTVAEATAETFNVGGVFSHIMIGAVMAAGAFFVLQGSITTGALIAAVLLSGRMFQPIQRALALWARYQDYSLSREKVESIFSVPKHIFVPDAGLRPERDGTLALRNVFFRHKKDGPWILRDINLNLTRGDNILLDGTHGAGRTTFLELMSGLYAPTQGEIIIDGHNILSYPPEKITSHVGYVETEGVIFRGTIRDNLTCFGQISEQQVREVASLLKVDRDIAKMPSGLDTFLNGNHTDNVTPGLKQRIAIVRALAPKPRIIMFDDADRALDKEGYNLVYNLLARISGKIILILITDDENLRSLADRHLVLHQGALTEIPINHPHYMRLHYRQQGMEKYE